MLVVATAAGAAGLLSYSPPAVGSGRELRTAEAGADAIAVTTRPAAAAPAQRPLTATPATTPVPVPPTTVAPVTTTVGRVAPGPAPPASVVAGPPPPPPDVVVEEPAPDYGPPVAAAPRRSVAPAPVADPEPSAPEPDPEPAPGSSNPAADDCARLANLLTLVDDGAMRTAITTVGCT
ncbi:MAG: hypothetical protein QOE93_987 [Actinomycetota bacterium]|nr:hypothetical protein [Actinomycetota bacterium]